MAVRYGASAVGLVSEMPSGPGIISEDLIADIARSVPPTVAAFLLTCKQDAAPIIAQQRKCRVNTIQLCDHMAAHIYAELREALPGVALVQVIHVSGTESVDEAVSLSSEVDALLLDSGNRNLPVKELGGTGRRHDWAISRAIVEAVEVPVFLAGGLNSTNVAEAIERVRPFGIDVCSGVRTDGRLDEEKLKSFFAAIP
jgi:phosphoribosylanthranilate isomerase